MRKGGMGREVGMRRGAGEGGGDLKYSRNSVISFLGIVDISWLVFDSISFFAVSGSLKFVLLSERGVGTVE